MASILTPDPSAASAQSLVLHGRTLDVVRAVTRDEAGKLKEANEKAREKADKRNMYLLREGGELCLRYSFRKPETETPFSDPPEQPSCRITLCSGGSETHRFLQRPQVVVGIKSVVIRLQDPSKHPEHANVCDGAHAETPRNARDTGL